MNGEKQKFIGGIDFDELKAQRVQLYNTITINLATVRANEEMVFTGNYIYALEATDVDANLDIRFNELFRATINVKKGRGVRVPFYRFYITNTAQAGKSVTLAIGIEASDFEIFDVGKALGITGLVYTAPSPRAGYAQIAVSGEADDATVILHTVTAGKIFYLVGAHAGMVTAASFTTKLMVTNAADVEQYAIFESPQGAVATQMPFPSYYPSVPLEIPAGYKIKLFSSGATHKICGFIHGYEV